MTPSRTKTIVTGVQWNDILHLKMTRLEQGHCHETNSSLASSTEIVEASRAGM